MKHREQLSSKAHSLAFFRSPVIERSPGFNIFMGKHVHIMEAIDLDKKTGICKHCGPVKVKKKRDRYLCRNSQKRWTRSEAAKARRLLERRPYRSELQDHCERCGFVPEVKCQLDVHHIDGNHENNAKWNLATVCANCHRLIHSRSVASCQDRSSSNVVKVASE